MVLEIVVEFLARSSLDQLTGPVNVDTVLPGFTGLVDEWLREIIMVGARKLIQPLRASPVDESLIEERVAESSCRQSAASTEEERVTMSVLGPQRTGM